MTVVVDTDKMNEWFGDNFKISQEELNETKFDTISLASFGEILDFLIEEYKTEKTETRRKFISNLVRLYNMRAKQYQPKSLQLDIYKKNWWL